ncbi:MAG: hypothetical protein IJJ41_06500 [Clostridia bacterium]|nr:hypothetical protein [Clostridia bacterium]
MFLPLMCFGGESTAPAQTTAAEAESTAAETGVGTRETAASGGEQPQQAQPAPAGERSEQEQPSYRSFKEQFKEQYQADLQRVIDKRFKNAKKVEAQRDALQSEKEQYRSLLGALEQKYGTSDLEELCGKIAEDGNAAGEADREEGGAQPDAEPEEGESRQAQSEQVQQLIEQWQQEAEELTTLYPSFSLEQEVENETFARALQSGMCMRDAYQAAHFDEILGGVIAYTAQNVKSEVAGNRAMRAARPAENGTHAGAAAIVKSDVSKLSKQEMEEIDKRVLRGEKISF